MHKTLSKLYKPEPYPVRFPKLLCHIVIYVRVYLFNPHGASNMTDAYVKFHGRINEDDMGKLSTVSYVHQY